MPKTPPGYIVLNEDGQRYVKYVPVCPVHGPMPRDDTATPPEVAWECCGVRITSENLPWIPFTGDVPPPPFMPRPRSGRDPLS